MLIRVKPCWAYHWLSARVENRGPSMTTMVPPSTTLGRPDAAAYAQRAQRPHVGAVGHGVRRELVLNTVTRQKGHLVFADGADGDRCARGTVRGVESDAACVGSKERVKAATADDSEHPTILADGALAGRAQVGSV